MAVRSCHHPNTAQTIGATAAPHTVPSAPATTAPPTAKGTYRTAHSSAWFRLRREAPRACRPMAAP